MICLQWALARERETERGKVGERGEREKDHGAEEKETCLCFVYN